MVDRPHHERVRLDSVAFVFLSHVFFIHDAGSYVL